MSEIEVRDTDDEVVTPDEQEAPYEGFQRAVYPELDGEGGTRFVFGGPATDEEASREDWAAQNVAPNTRGGEEVVDEEDDGGSPNPDDPNYNP